MSRPIVTILGAGIGGLTLGRCLLSRGISCIIYDRANAKPRHTYGITLEAWAYKPLLNVLELDEETFRKTLAVDNWKADGLGKVSDLVSESVHDKVPESFRANRSRLEILLREGLDIRFEHSLSSAKLSKDTKEVDLHFENGLKVRPALVVDAMGVHSSLRKALLPDVEPAVQPYAVFSGKRYVKKDEFMSTYSPYLKDSSIIVQRPGQANSARLEISINDYPKDGDVSISYIYSRAAKTKEDDPIHNPHRPQTKATEIPDAFFEEVQDLIETGKVESPFKECFDRRSIESDRILHWLMRTVLVPKQFLSKLTEHGIVVIGDAAHAVPILGGHGANLAIADALHLAQIITGSGQDNVAFQNFIEKKWSEWNEAVTRSVDELTKMHSVSSSSL